MSTRAGSSARRGTSALSPLGLRGPRRGARREAAGPQLRPRRRRDHAELGHVEARDRAWASRATAGRSRCSARAWWACRPRGWCRKRVSPSPSTPPRCRPTRPRTSPAASSTRSACSATTTSRPNSRRSSPARSIIAGGASRSWSATITASAGCRPMSRPTARKPRLHRQLPADQPHARPRPSIRSRSAACCATTRCTSKPAATSGR